jgi:putative transposase
MLRKEELVVKSMVKRPEPKRDEEGELAPNGAGRKENHNRSIHDAAPAMLLQIIKTKAEEAGSWFSMADTKIVKPTQRCYCCGTLVKKELDERWHRCPSCNVHCDRDENAARTFHRVTFIATGMKMRLALCFAGFTKVISGWEPTSPVKARHKLHP